MTKNQHNRRNFLSSIAILSAGTVVASGVKPLSLTTSKTAALDKSWELFWKKSGGQIYNGSIGSISQHAITNTSGHLHQNGQIIFFAKENVLVQPIWIYWGNDHTYPKDVVITIFENNETQKRIARLNRFEIDAVYKLSKEHSEDQLLLTPHNVAKPSPGITKTFIQNKTFINRYSSTQQLSYYKRQSLVFHKKLIYNV